MSDTFASRGTGRFNNFDALRFFFAAGVLFSHSFALLCGSNEQDPLFRLTHGLAYLGELCVDGFFIISGYLIAASWTRSRGPGDFLKRRCQRIYPGYVTVFILSTLVVAPLGGALLHDVLNGRHLVQSVARMMTFSYLNTPGAFSTLPYPQNINGSLWTIRYEFECYLMVMALGLTIGLQRRWTIVALFSAAIAAMVAQHYDGLLFLDRDIPGVGNPIHFPRFVAYFAAGMVVYLYRDRLPYSGLLAAGLLAALVAGAFVPVAWNVLLPVCLPYLVFYLAFSTAIPLQHFGERGDISYGLYLYGWPVQQLLLWKFLPHLNPYTLFLTSFVCTIPLAVVSWIFIEKPFLHRLKKPAAPAQPLVVTFPAVVYGIAAAPLPLPSPSPIVRPSTSPIVLDPVSA